MVSIWIGGEDKTAEITNWSIWSDKDHGLQLKYTCTGKRKLVHALSECSISPMREMEQVLLREHGSTVLTPISKATIYGERYAAVYYSDRSRPYIRRMADISLVAPTTLHSQPVFQYFADVANRRHERAGSSVDSKMYENVSSQLRKLPASADTALHAYCTGTISGVTPGLGLIYPFGLNESQLAAVERAFRAQISVIEGPPGTGKTQTILNIIANIVLRGQTVAVVSNNNSAVENVYEKLERYGLGYLIAKLGNKDNRKAFFVDLPSWPSGDPETAPTLDEIQAVLKHLKQHLRDQNRAAQLKAELEELTVERRYLERWQADSGLDAIPELEKYRLSPRKVADLMAYLAHLGERRIRIKDRIELLFNYRIFRASPFAQGGARLGVFFALQMHYYDKAIREKEAELQACRESLARGNFEALLKSLEEMSLKCLRQHLHSHPPTKVHFDFETYRKKFDDFVRRFPVIGSGTHSIVNSLASGAVLDYVIVDEASLQDIVPGILPLGCAKNLIVVGDRRQLAHIPVKLGLSAPVEAYDCERYSLLDSCIAVFRDTLPRTLLKEHYRCHPKIIQFCNQQYYDNALVTMTEDKGEAPMRLIVTAKGNHTRGNTNLRELDSVLKVLDDEEQSVVIDGEGRGFIAPFRAQVNLSGSSLPEAFVKDTVHKFQGRECEEIIFSTVLDKKRYNQEPDRIRFVDDAQLVNVAVSRAKKRFTLVTGDDVFTSNNGHIAALMRYITYYMQDDNIIRAPIVSAFDLLYREFDASLARLNARLRSEDSRYKSEQIVAQLLREALSLPACQSLTFHSQIRLNQVASPNNPKLTQRERDFMARASCDFVIYFKVGKTPLGVIEVDGGSHMRPDQAARDSLKNSVLEKSGISLLRLRTIESRIAERVGDFVSQWVSSSA